MAKKEKQNEMDASLDLDSIIKGIDGATVLYENHILNTRGKVRSKIEILNCLLGGGRPYGSITGSFGPPTGGKSTEAYESAAEFLRQEPDGIVIILDQESSADPSRLEFLGLNTHRSIRVKSESIDSGFDKLLELIDVVDKKQKIVNKKIPIFVVWDTITKGKSEDDEEASRMGARNRARVIKSRMNDLNPWLDKIDVILILLNQVILGSDMYGNETVNAGGGVGLKHDEHLRLYINKKKTKYDDLTGMATQDFSTIALDKTKLSPKINNIPVVFDVINGGRIDEEYSFLLFFEERKLFLAAGGWWHITPIIEMSSEKPYYDYLSSFSGNKRYDDWVNLIKTNNHNNNCHFKKFSVYKTKFSYYLKLNKLFKTTSGILIHSS